MEKGDIVIYKKGSINYDNITIPVNSTTSNQHPMIVLEKLNTKLIGSDVIPICKVMTSFGQTKWVIASKLNVISKA